jgi:hypothetical protein
MTAALERVSAVVDAAAAVVLGLAAGAMLAEGALLVPYWRALPPRVFLAWYAANAERLVAFFGPLEVAAAALALLAAVLHWSRRTRSRVPFTLAATLAVVVLLSFPIYFRDVNASFATGTIAVDAVPGELARWARWHWCRTALGVAACVSAVVGIGRRASVPDPSARRAAI